MPIDPRIALGVQAPQIESPMNVMAKAMELQSMQRQNALFERQQAELMRKQQQEAALNAAYSNALTPEGRLDEGKLSNYLARAGAGSAIPGAMEAVGKGREAQLKARGAELEQARSNYSTYNRAMLAVANRPDLTKDMAASTARALAAAGIVNPDIVEQGIAQMGDDPEQLRAAILSGARQTMTDEQISEVFGSKLEFRSLGGGEGAFDPYSGKLIRSTPNIPEPDVVIRQKERVAAAGAPPPSRFETAYGVDVSKAAAARDEAAVAAAQQAAGDLEGDYRVLALLAQGKPVTGAFAPIKLEFDKLRNLVKGDKEAAERVTDTELLNSLLGKDVFASIQALGVGARGLDTPAEREYLREVVAGTISMSPDTLARMTEIRANIRERAIDKYNARVERGELDRYFQYSGLPKQKLPKPERPKAPAASAAAEVEVNIPGRGVVRFPNQKAADDFKKAAGL